MKRSSTWILALILLIAAVLRFYQLGSIPVSLTWDETSVGYDAWAVATHGMDQWGNRFPLVFKSYEDDKHPVHIYMTALSVAIWGLNEFSTRLPAALFGVLNVYLIYLLAGLFTREKSFGLFAAGVMALSPYAIQFSRWEHELQFAIFFFLLGCWAFFKGLEKGKLWLVLAFTSWGIDLLTYHSAKVVLPVILLFLLFFYQQPLRRHIKHTIIGLSVFLLFIGLLVAQPALLGTARVNQTSYKDQELRQVSTLYEMTGIRLLGQVEITLRQYGKHFNPDYLFTTGDINYRHSSQLSGQFYWLDLPFFIIGVFFLLRQRKIWAYFLLLWALLGPLPASLVKEAPHSARAMYMVGSWHLIIAFGMFSMFHFLKNKTLKFAVTSLVLVVYLFFALSFFNRYLTEYAQKSGVDWQYGMKAVVEYSMSSPYYTQIYVTSERHRPYIYYLYYLKTPPQEFQKTVTYTQCDKRSYNLVSQYDKFHFGDWDPIESKPLVGTLYVLTPSEYSGLRSKQSFIVKKKIEYPNGTDAFYLVSAY